MSDPRPRRSWIELILDGIARVPGPAWILYLAATLVIIFTGTLLAWADGTVPAGEFDFVRIYTDASILWQLAVLHYLRFSIGRAFDAFAPALGDLAPQRDEIRARLTRIPTWVSLLAIPLGLAYAASFILGDPAGVGLHPASGPALWAFVAVTTVINGPFFAALVLWIVRTMVLISRLHATATAVSVYDATAHGAFARVTLRSSIGLALPVYVFTLYQLIAGDPAAGVSLPVLLTIVSLVGGSIAVFFIPLAGMHARLVRQRSELVTAVNIRLEAAGTTLHAAADAGDLTPIDGIEKLFAALVAEREVVRRLSTWPWEPDTLRGFLSSIALPIVIWLITTLLGRLLGP